MSRLLLALLFSAVLAGCASTPDLPKDHALDATRSEGLLIASMTLSGKPLSRFNGLEFNIRQLPLREDEMVTKTPRFSSANQHARWAATGGESRSEKTAWKAIVKDINATEPLDIVEDNKPSGRLVALRLPAGEYEIYSWKAVERTSFGEMEYRPKKTFSHRFTVNPGVATYFGRLQLQLGDGDLQRLVIADQKNADLVAFKSKYPKIGVSIMN